MGEKEAIFRRILDDVDFRQVLMDLDLILECEPSGAVSYYVSDEGSGEEAEGLVRDTGDELLARALRRLASVG